MGTPFISLLEPTKLDGYIVGAPREQQPSHIPKVFCDAMDVRQAVFVQEQGVPAANEFDEDDARSCHWVVYASVNQVVEPEQRNSVKGEVVRPRRSETKTQPVGTMRAIPFPHPPHPPEGGRYEAGVLQKPQGEDSTSKRGEVCNDRKGPVLNMLSPADEPRQTAALPYGQDRATVFHDGKEPYVKIGRLAVIPEFRGHRVASQLWRAARQLLEENPNYFTPSVEELSMDQLKVTDAQEIPKWDGLVCCHSAELAVKTYERWGFKLDEGMGTWFEDNIPCVGMFIRLKVTNVPPKVR